MHFLSVCLIMLLYKKSEAVYSFQCPVRSHWKHRSKTFCDSDENYLCLYNQNENNFTEFCKEDTEFEGPGQKLIVAGSIKGTLQGADCDKDFYQPYQFLSPGNSRCAFRKSYCSEQGQISLSNGTVLMDRLCRCDYTRGFDFIVRPKQQCQCEPTEEDCSCYLKICSSKEILSPDYECLDKNTWKKSFKCDQIVTLLHDDIEVFSTINPWYNTYVSVNIKLKKYRKRACVTVVCLILIIMTLLVIWLLALKCFPLHFKRYYSDNLTTEAIDENIENKNATVEANEFKREKGKLEFQKETLSNWAGKLDKFVKTRAADVIYNYTKTKNVILIAGPSGIGKSSFAYYVAFKLKAEAGFTILPVRKPVDIIDYHVQGKKQVFVMDDVIGKYTVDEKDVEAWVTNGSKLKIIFSEKVQTKVILTSRKYIWQPEWYEHLNIPFCSTCDLLSEDLQLLVDERMNIFKCYMSHINTDVTKTLVKKEIMMFNNFPSVCAMYSSSNKTDGNHFLKVLLSIIKYEINNFKTKSQINFIALAFLAIEQSISINSLTFDNTQHDELLQDLFYESTFVQNPSKHLLKSSLAAFKGEYVREEHICFMFIYETMQNIVLYCIAETFMNSVIKYCKLNVIINNFRMAYIDEEQYVFTMKVTKENRNAYFQRLVIELKNGFYKEVFGSGQNKCPQFREQFLDHIKLNIRRNELTKTQDGKTVLHVVSALGYHEYVSFFIQDKHMIDKKDNAGNIPLHLACKNGCRKTVKYLVENKSSVDISNNEGLKPFFYACENNFIEVAKYMLHYSTKRIQVNEKFSTKNKRCVLHVVCANGYTNLVVLLLKNYAKVDVKDADGYTPLHLACYKGNSGTVSALLDSNANADAVDSFGRTAVYIACSEKHKRVLQLLLESKAGVNQTTNDGKTPLCVSCINENIAFVSMLLKNGAKVNSKKPNVLPLHEACKVGNESIVNMLVLANSSVNHKTKEGVTPLHEACKNGHVNVVKILLDNKAVVNDQDKHEWPALIF